jgi:hypothetical protein
MTISRALALLLVCVTLLGHASPAWADEPAVATGGEAPTGAAALKAQGDDAMQRLDYSKALALYEQAYALEKNAALLYNRGRALQALRRFPEALDALEAFEREAAPELKTRVPKLGELVTEVRGKVSVLVLSCNVEGARVVVGQRVIGTTPLPGPVRLNAGTAQLEVTADGHHPYRSRVQLPPAGPQEVQVPR